MEENFSPKTSPLPISGENVWLWLVKIVTGPLLVILLLIHLIVNHFISQTGLLTYANVVAYYRNPVIPIMEICFLAVVVIHSLIGLRGILLDLKPSRTVLRILDLFFVIAGISAVSYGVWLILTIVSKGS
jgi:succinate dehydrogenase / fumarate reductase membrane anchor subunit